MIADADTSLLVSLFIEDVHSVRATVIMANAAVLVVHPLHRAEFENAVALCGFRRQITAADAVSVRINFARQLSAGIYALRPWPEAAWTRAAALSRQFIAELGVRTLDVLHVAAALELEADAFYTFDLRQRRLAARAGLRCR